MTFLHIFAGNCASRTKASSIERARDGGRGDLSSSKLIKSQRTWRFHRDAPQVLGTLFLLCNRLSSSAAVAIDSVLIAWVAEKIYKKQTSGKKRPPMQRMGSPVGPTKTKDVRKRCARREDGVRRDDDGRAGTAGTRNQGGGGSTVAVQRACHARPCPALVPVGRPSMSVASPLPVRYNRTPPRAPQGPGQSTGYTRR